MIAETDSPFRPGCRRLPVGPGRSGRQAVLLLLLLSACLGGLGCSRTPVDAPVTADDGPAPAQGGVAPTTAIEEAPAGAAASGSTYYIAPDGSDANDGSEASPWATIQHAVDSVAPGDTILIRTGTYVGARIGRSGNEAGWITLAAAPGANVLINTPGPGNKHGSNLEFETWEGAGTVAFWVVDGLEVAQAPHWGIDVRGSETAHSHHFIIRNNRVHDNGLGTEKTGIFTAFTDDVIIEDNESYGNGEHGIYLSNSGDRFVVRGNRLHGNDSCGVHINGDQEQGGDGIISNGLIENNIIYNNGAGGCAGVNLDGVTDTVVRNNLLYGNLGSGIAIFQESGSFCSQNIQVLNNTIVQAEAGRWAVIISGENCINNKIFNNIILSHHAWRGSIVIPVPGITGFESDYNIIMDRFSADGDESVIALVEWRSFGYDAHSIIAAPGDLFAGGDNYRLQAQSPAVDAGRALPGVAADLEGVPRPSGEAFDIGAFEFEGGADAQPGD